MYRFFFGLSIHKLIFTSLGIIREVLRIIGIAGFGKIPTSSKKRVVVLREITNSSHIVSDDNKRPKRSRSLT